MAKATWACSIGTNSLWIHRKCLLICWIVGIANMQYGFDSAAVGALQAMPGFLRVFGYEDPKNPTGYGIDVGRRRPNVSRETARSKNMEAG